MRDATLEDYRWLYAHGYMPDGLKCSTEIMHEIVARCPGTFFDFGCGRGDLVARINKSTTGHAIGWDAMTGEQFPAISADWTISCDVLEHIAPGALDDVLALFRRITRKGLLLTIANMSDVHPVNGEAVQLHLIRQPLGWWTQKILDAYPGSEIWGRSLDHMGHRFAIVVHFP